MGGADKIFAVFFDGVLLSQKTHRLLLASVNSSQTVRTKTDSVVGDTQAITTTQEGNWNVVGFFPPTLAIL